MRHVWKAVREDLTQEPVNLAGERPVVRQCSHNHMTHQSAENCMLSVRNEHCGFNSVNMVRVPGNGKDAN